jgi:hypothetical protein
VLLPNQNKTVSGHSRMLSQIDLYGNEVADRSVAQHGGYLCSWLRQRAKAVHSITFHRFKVWLQCMPLTDSVLRGI